MSKMINQKKTVAKEPFWLIDQQILTKDQYFYPFALTDALTAVVGEKKQSMVHFWQLDHVMILGMKDTRVPFLAEGLRSLTSNDYHYLVRNAGGLGVIADEGVLNVSLLFPQHDDKRISIDEAYVWMWQWLKSTFEDKFHEIDAFEVSDSYCPGNFDLSIHGKKFAGIAQRRVKGGIAVMLYLSVTGDQQKRGETVRSFYKTSLKESFGMDGYPPVNPEVMENLSTLLNKPLTVETVKQRLSETLQEWSDAPLDRESFKTLEKTSAFQTEFRQQLDKMKERNNLLREEKHDIL